MEYIYAAMLIHKAGGAIKEDAVTKVLSAAGVKVDEVRVKALVAALDGVNIEEAIQKAAVAAAPVAVAASAEAPKKEAKKEEPKEEDTGAAAAGLGALFG